MLATDLRAHLRVRSNSHAVLRFPTGGRERCLVSDLSMGGAYLVRSGSAPFAPVVAGTMVELVLDPDPMNPVVVDAEVVRAEASGPGLAVRFHIYDDIAPIFVQHVVGEAAGLGIEAHALGVPLMRTRPTTDQSAVRHWLRWATPLAAAASLWWGARILNDWLGAVL